jgi:hypothetical protein
MMLSQKLKKCLFSSLQLIDINEVQKHKKKNLRRHQLYRHRQRPSESCAYSLQSYPLSEPSPAWTPGTVPIGDNFSDDANAGKTL